MPHGIGRLFYWAYNPFKNKSLRVNMVSVSNIHNRIVIEVDYSLLSYRTFLHTLRQEKPIHHTRYLLNPNQKIAKYNFRITKKRWSLNMQLLKGLFGSGLLKPSLLILERSLLSLLPLLRYFYPACKQER